MDDPVKLLFFFKYITLKYLVKKKKKSLPALSCDVQLQQKCGPEKKLEIK